jgi:hypothetical protein
MASHSSPKPPKESNPIGVANNRFEHVTQYELQKLQRTEEQIGSVRSLNFVHLLNANANLASSTISIAFYRFELDF